MTIEEIMGAFGISWDIAQAVAAAELDPTSAHVNAVVEAYARQGMVVPAQLYAHLIEINEQRHPEDTVRGSMLPWLVAIGAGVWFLFRRR